MANINYYAGINMVGSDIDFNKNEATAIVIDNQATAPTSPVEGQMYFDTTAGDKTMYFYNGSSWVEMDGSGSGVSQLTAGSGISLSASTGNVTVTNSGVLSVTTTDGTYIDLTPNSATTGAVTVTADISAVDGTASAGTRFLDKNNKWSVPAGAYTKWQYQTDGGTAIDMVDGEVLNFIGGTGITLADAAATPNTLTITNSGVTSIVAGTGISVSGATGAVTVTNTVTDTSYTLPTTNGSNPDLVLTPSSGSTDIVHMEGTSGTVTVTGSGTDTLTFDLADDVTITGDLTVNGGDITLAGTGRIQGIDTVSASTDAASKGYVDGLVSGGLTFKDGFNAGTGAIDGGGNLTTGASRVAISVGDYYVVTTAGSFYGSVSLDVGDSVICKEAAAQGASDVNDWVIVQSDEGVSALSSGNAVSASTGQAITSNTGATGAVTVQSFPYDGGSNVGHVPTGGGATTFLRGDGTWVTPTDTTTNNYVDSLAWNTGNGVLTVGRSGLSDLTVDLDGRYITENETITLSGDVTGSGTTAITTTIAADAVEASMLNDNVISGQTAVTTIAGTDELLISDAGVLKRTDVTNLSDQIFKGNTYAATINAFGAVTHGLGTYDVIVQLYDAGNYETIKAGVDRTGTNEVTISGNSFPAGNIRVLVTAIQG